LHSTGYAMSGGQGGAMGRLARSCARVAGGRAAYPGLGSRDADPPPPPGPPPLPIANWP
jgi:hypothetical protein